MPRTASLVAEYASNESVAATGLWAQYSLPRHVDAAWTWCAEEGEEWSPSEPAMEDAPGAKGCQVSYANVHAHTFNTRPYAPMMRPLP